MGFSAYGKFVGVEPVVPDSGLIKLVEGVEDNRSVFRVVSVGHEVEGISVGQCVIAIRSAEFKDKGTGVTLRLCHVNEIVGVGEIDGVAPVVITDPSLN